MLGFCELTSCRRQTLLKYFGDTLEQPCGNCDNCLYPAQTWDATEAARKALSCVYRTGQRFGAHHLIDVLLGKFTDRIRNFGHDKISTYGIGKDLSEPQWLSVFRQLVTQGFLEVDLEQYAGLRLADACRPILRGEQALFLRRDEHSKALKPVSRDSSRRAVVRFENAGDEDLWQDLRALRSRLALGQDVPAYVILHDAVLLEMVRLRPQTMEKMAEIEGIGERKLGNYGHDFLKVIVQHKNDSGNGKLIGLPSPDESLSLFQIGMSVEQIAKRRELKPSTIYGHLAQAVGNGSLDVLDVTGLSKDQAMHIQAVWKNLSEQDKGVALKPLFEALIGQYDYAILRCLKESWGMEA
jgi:ATP-dependent DNA helicase RecQ